MLNFLPGFILGPLSFLLLLINTLFWTIFLYSVAIFKLIIPNKTWRKLCNIIINEISTLWITINSFNWWLTQKIDWDVNGQKDFVMNEWYLVISNHQSWVDIFVLQKIFNRRIPFLKFFLKKELIWVPIMGLVWWAQEYPFMKRYSKDFLKKNPHLKGKDLEVTRKACEKFRTTPVSIMNFVEGTRFTKAKHHKQQSPFKNLLKPKAGGVAFVLSAMGEHLNAIINVTIVYPDGVKGFWAFLCGKLHKVKVNIEIFPIDKGLTGDYFNDAEFRERFHQWMNTIWTDKDKQIEKMLGT